MSAILPLITPQPWRACRECHRKKTKCDMQRPRCGLCLRTGKNCVFPSKRKSPAKPDHSRLKISRALDAIPRQRCEIIPSSPNLPDLTCSNTPASWLPVESVGVTLSPEQFHQTLFPLVDDYADPLNPPFLSLDPCLSGCTTDSSYANTSPSSQPLYSQQPTLSSVPERLKPISISIANELIHVFFDRIQPFLPLLHKPQFLERCRQDSKGEELHPDDLRPDTALLFYAMFALSARFSTHPAFINIPCLDRGEIYATHARQVYGDSRSNLDPSLQYSQGCILLAFYFYTSGLSSEGWILVGVCVRIAYDLGLSTIDDDERGAEATVSEWQEKELRRRAWWSVCELDNFGPIIMCRPFAVDRRHRVHLPVSDDDWFLGNQKRSAPISLEPGKCWRSLISIPNQSKWAWYIVANSLFSLANDWSLSKIGIPIDEKLTLQNDITCLQMSLPPSFQIGNLQSPHVITDQQNWIVGTNIMLTVAQLMASKLAVRPSSRSVACGSAFSDGPSLESCISRLSAILRNWSMDGIAAAHPFLSCAISPIRIYLSCPAQSSAALSSFSDIVGLVQNIFARHWHLGSIASCESSLVLW